jgi:integrase
MGGFRDEGSVRRKWLGGYVREGVRGQMFIIERWIHGDHFHITTKCRTERAALGELARFEADPAGYTPQDRTQRARTPCVITPEMIDEYESFQVLQKQTTESHARTCARYLEQWMLVFGGRDIRRLDLHRDIKTALDQWQKEAIADDDNPRLKKKRSARTGARHARIVALKGFATWLRREKGWLKRGEDPTLDLQVPQVRPEKLQRKKVVPFAHVQKILPLIRTDCRDTLMLLANTGLHVAEVRRFSKTGEIFEPTPEFKQGGAEAMLTVRHKNGRLHTIALTTPEAVEAAQRIRTSGWAPSHSVMWFAMHAACAAAKVPAFNAGVLRHSVATWLHEAGVELAAISEQLGHRDPRTTADFYRDMGGQARALPMPVLRLVK